MYVRLAARVSVGLPAYLTANQFISVSNRAVYLFITPSVCPSDCLLSVCSSFLQTFINSTNACIICMPAFQPTCLATNKSFCPCVFQHISPSLWLCIIPSAGPYVWPLVRLSVCTFVRYSFILAVCLSICLPVYLSTCRICPYISQFIFI